MGRDPSENPLHDLEDWDDFVRERYPEPGAGAAMLGDARRQSSGGEAKSTADFRDYENDRRGCVREFYRLNHARQTVELNRQKRAEYLSLDRRRMGIWEAMEFLNRLVDDSDPDTDLSQLEHLLQSAEAVRADGHPRWFILTALIHDLGKILCLYGEPQWAVVGDTFPVGCRYSDKVVFPEFFRENPDWHVEEYQTPAGIYEDGCGLDTVLMSWGHDEYLYHVVRDHLPEEALYMIRYHSFYAAHREGEYQHLMTDHDRDMFEWVRRFNPYDLYSKSHEAPDTERLRPYYEALIAEYFPPSLSW